MTLFIAFLCAISGSAGWAAVFIVLHWVLSALRQRGIVL